MSRTDPTAESTESAARFPLPAEGILVAHFIVSADVERSRRFYTDVLGGVTVKAGEPSYVALANSWIIINVGGEPTDDCRRSHSRLRVTATGPTASSTFGWRTSMPYKPSGRRAAPSS
jgi:hypothetical protein